VYSFLAAGRPILYIGPEESTLARIAEEGCGWHHEPGDVEGILALIQQLGSDRDLLKQASNHARRSFREKYDKPQGPRRVATLLLSKTAKPRVIRRVEAEISETDLKALRGSS
jgi:hypothetical protein